jgi:hypothetical protein
MIDYYVIGGEFMDTDFDVIVNNSYVKYGPFSTYYQAEQVWLAKSKWQIDNALYKLEIVER